MKFSRENILAQGVQLGNHSCSLSGFSFAALLSAAELTTRRYMWSDMTDLEWDEIDALTAQLQEELFRNIMIGTVVAYMGDVIPDNLLLCDGGTYAREDYPDLYAVLPASLIVDSDNFSLPDMAGLTVLGTSPTYAHLSQGGEAEHILSEAEIPSHSHTYTPPIPNVDLETPGAPDLLAAGVGPATVTGSAGGDQAHNNMQPYIALYWCMVAR